MPSCTSSVRLPTLIYINLFCLYELSITFELLITCIMCKTWWSWTAVPLRTLKGINSCSEGLEYIMCIKLGVLPAFFIPVSDHFTCKIYSMKWPFGTFGFLSWNKNYYYFFHSAFLLRIYPKRFALVWFAGMVIYKPTHTE